MLVNPELIGTLDRVQVKFILRSLGYIPKHQTRQVSTEKLRKRLATQLKFEHHDVSRHISKNWSTGAKVGGATAALVAIALGAHLAHTYHRGGEAGEGMGIGDALTRNLGRYRDAPGEAFNAAYDTGSERAGKAYRGVADVANRQVDNVKDWFGMGPSKAGQSEDQAWDVVPYSAYRQLDNVKDWFGMGPSRAGRPLMGPDQLFGPVQFQPHMAPSPSPSPAPPLGPGYPKEAPYPRNVFPGGKPHARPGG